MFGLMRGLRLEELINLSKQSVVVCVPLPSFPKFQESRGGKRVKICRAEKLEAYGQSQSPDCFFFSFISTHVKNK